MDSADEAFQNFIEIDEDFEETTTAEAGEQNIVYAEHEESDKENIIPISKTRQVQINKIIAFVKEHNEQLIEKTAYDCLWDTLSEELNKLGPPTNTTKKWRHIWSIYKYNNKKRLPALIAAPCQDEPSNRTEDSVTCELVENVLISELSQNVSLVLVQQKRIMETLYNQSVAIERSNSLLEEIYKKIK